MAAATRSGKELFETIKANNEAQKPVQLLWDLDEVELQDLADVFIEEHRKLLDAVGVTKDSPSYKDTIQPLLMGNIWFSLVDSICTFPNNVADSKSLRDASSEADKKLSTYSVEASTRHDVYLAVEAWNASCDHAALSAEDARYLKFTLRNFRRQGLHLPEAERAKIKAIKEKISNLQVDFGKNNNEENTKIPFALEELEGIPKDLLDTLEKTNDGKLLLTLKYPHYIPTMKLCKVDATRQTMEKAFNSRCVPANVKILEELVTLRHEAAALLGYPTHAAFIQEVRMAQHPDNVEKFLSDLSDKLTALQAKEVEVLIELKKKEKEARGEAFEAVTHPYELAYYRNKVEEEHYNVDHQALKEYFPIEKVTAGLLQIYQELLGLDFKLTTEHEVWHPDVQMFEVKDSTTGALIGHFYLDLYPRDGKYGHAACWGLQSSCTVPSTGKRQLPVAACVCNFTKPTESKPSLLLHDEVTTFFHEFGHCMHQICSLAQHQMFSGTSVERDFVEAPSQMLENWTWEGEALARMSGHYKDSSAIPDAMLQSLIKSKNANAGILNKRQIFLATFDKTIHTSPTADTAKTMADLTKSICGFDMTPGTNMSASFGHLGGGYDAQYYGYLWSDVYASDMYETRFAKEGIFNPKVGKDYRDKILAPGGSRDAVDMIQDFLGRPPTNDAFLRSKGL